MRPTVLLFDIDGTLVSTGGAGRRAIERALERAGFPGTADFSFAGMTDRAIVRAALGAASVAATEARIDEVLEGYVAVLADEVARAGEGYRVHDGMVAALDAARGRPRVAVGLGTGNVERGAHIKLEKVGLRERFAFGGFGSDHEDWPELIRIGAARGARELGEPLAACRVVVIGDTPKDIAAARAIGAACVAVATGSFSVAELAPHGADRVCASLAEPGALDSLWA